MSDSIKRVPVSVDIWVRRGTAEEPRYVKVPVDGEVEASVTVRTVMACSLSDVTDMELRRAAGQLEAAAIKKLTEEPAASTPTDAPFED